MSREEEDPCFWKKFPDGHLTSRKQEIQLLLEEDDLWRRELERKLAGINKELESRGLL